MELTDLQIYIALIVGTGASVTFVLHLVKWIYHRYSQGLDSRISGCIDKRMETLSETQAKHGERIKSLEDRFHDFWKYLRGPTHSI
jgi:hypothetical protein